MMLDTFARTALWEAGLDYRHGTGHGVGAFLNVHEGPCGIGYRPRADDMGLEAGMVLSNGTRLHYPLSSDADKLHAPHL